ncbi:RNA polymerase sigma factor [Ekhidna sp.]|uniref:RNA polymerase sigma factor n=1 Tax=Ekhidna sp. TaxID=2608089 RepID=UPI003C7DD47F
MITSYKSTEDAPGMKESDIIRRILSGEKELYEILVRRNNQKLFRCIRGYLSDEEEIKDVMQNSYLKAFDKLSQFKLQASFSTWLIRIAMNEALVRLKQKGKIVELNVKDMVGSENGLDDNVYREHNPQSRMIRKEGRELLERAIGDLDAIYRTTYIMKELEEMSIEEIADVLNISVSNVKIRLHRARLMLRESLYELSQDKDLFEFGFSKCDDITERVMKAIQ